MARKEKACVEVFGSSVWVMIHTDENQDVICECKDEYNQLSVRTDVICSGKGPTRAAAIKDYVATCHQRVDQVHSEAVAESRRRSVND